MQRTKDSVPDDYFRNRSPLWFVPILTGLILFLISSWIGGKYRAGDNFAIYQYLSTYKNAHGTYPAAGDGVVHKIDPVYRDYTPLNSFIYRGIFTAPKRFQQDAFILYEVLLLVIGLYCLRELCFRSVVPEDLFLCAVLFFLLNPLTYRLLAADDKAGFFAAPLLCLYCAEISAVAAAIAVGVFAGWLGLGAASIVALPALSKRRALQAIALVALALAVMAALMLIAGKDGLTAFHNRTVRESLTPFSVSIWRWFPAFLWPRARYPVICFFLAIFACFAWTGRLNFTTAFVATASTYLLFSSNTVPARILFFVPVLALCFESRNSRRAYLIFSFIALLVSHWLRRITPGFNPDVAVGVPLCNAVLIIPLANAFLRGFHKSQTKADDTLYSPAIFDSDVELSRNQFSARTPD